MEEAYAEERELTPEGAAMEDRLVTMAEYGAELEAEADHEPAPDLTQNTSGELQFIEPINYAEVIAGMDEDMRTAIDLFSQYRFLNPTIFGWNYYAFRNRYAIMGGFNRKQIVGYKDLDQLIQKERYPPMDALRGLATSQGNGCPTRSA